MIVTCFIVSIVSVSVVACFSRGVEEKSWDGCCLDNGFFFVMFHACCAFSTVSEME